MPLGMLDGDDDDDFDSLTPRSIRLRSPTPPPKRPTPVSSSQQQRPRPRQQQQQQQQQQSRQQSQQRQQQKHDRSQSTHTLKRPQSDPSQRMSTPTSSKTPITAAPSTSKPRTGLPLSLKKPAPKSNPSSQVIPPQTIEVATKSTTYSTTTFTTPRRLSNNSLTLREPVSKEAVMVVLDSESGDSDVDADRPVLPSTVFPEIALGSTQIGGVVSTQQISRTGAAQNHKRTSPIVIPSTKAQNTQESVASSQGSVDHCQEHDQLDNSFPVNKDPNSCSSSPVPDQHDTRMDCVRGSEVRWSLSPMIENPHLSDLVAATSASSSTSTESASIATSPTSPEPIVVDDGGDDDNDNDTYTRTTTSSIDISITSTIQTDDYLPSTLGGDELVECVVCGKLLTHLDSARVEYHINNCIDEQQQQQKQEQQADRPRTLTSHGEFAGARVDYLAKVKKCPICKLDWPSKAKTKASTVAPTRKARQKVEHMKRCAMANRRTIQSVLYQVRLLKERFERSLVLGTPMESASQDVGRELRSDEEERSSDEANPEESQSKVRRKPKVNIMVKKQVVSLTDNADADFTSDAIITTVHAPTATQPRLTKLERIHQDQQDDGLQMALAISMSMCENDSGSHSAIPGPSTTWTMAPANVRKGVKRRKQTDRDRNETTVLPFAEVQHLIQNNVHSLLFPEVDGPAVAGVSGGDGNSTGVLMKTPPWGPSRFTGDAEDADVEINLSQPSESGATSPTKSLWKLSHLKDTCGDSLEDATMRGVREASVALVQAGSGLAFDKEKYVTRFMRHYIQQDQDTREVSKSAGPASPEQGSSKFTSPLWSVSRSRRMSLMEQRRGLEAESVKSLKSEIVGHLDEMQRSIEQAKQVAYVKILESIERNPAAAARLTPPKSREPILVEDSGEANDYMVDEDAVVLSQDIQEGPSSPLLRYSKIPEQEKSESPKLFDSPPPTTSPKSLVVESVGSPVCEALSQDLNRSCTMDDVVNDLAMDDDDAYQDGDLVYSSGVMAYSPSPSPRQQSPPRLASPPPQTRAMTPYDFLDLSSPPEVEPPKTPVRRPRPKKNTRAPSPSSPDILLGELPPRLDFAKMGYHKADELADLENLDKEASGGWANVTTPKKSQRSNKATGRSTYKFGKRLPGQSQSQQETLMRKAPTAASISVRLEPLPATSAVGGEGGLEELGNWPTASQLIATRRAAALQDDEQELQPTSSQVLASPCRPAVSSQPAGSPHRPAASPQSAMSPRRSALGRPGSSLVESYRKAATRARNAANGTLQVLTESQSQTSSQTHAQNQSQSQSLSQNAPPHTPSNKAARARSKEFAAAAARAVDAMKAQQSMPRYDLMSVTTLRMLAIGFGLKATSKKLLSEQLTAIWERVNENSPKADQQEEGAGPQAEASNNGESSSRGGQLQQDRWRDMDQDEPAARSSQLLGQDDRTSSPPPFQSVDDTAPGYMSPILSDNDHTYDHLFDNDNHYDTNYNMDYDNNYRNFDNDLQLDNHSQEYKYGLDNDTGNDRSETFVNTKRGRGGSVDAVKDGKRKESYYKDEDDADGGVNGDQESEGSDEEDDFSQRTQDDEGEDDDDGGEDMEEPSDQEEPEITPPTLERQLFDFLSKASHFRKQYLTYKPLDLEQVWEECSAAQIRCTRQQLRQFLDKQSIICFVPAHSTLQSWRKTRAKKQKRVHP